MGAKPGTTAVVTYPCPGCQAALAVRADAPGGWSRCPRCGRASRPPAPAPPPARVEEIAGEGHDFAGLPPVELVPQGSWFNAPTSDTSQTAPDPAAAQASPETRALAAALARRREDAPGRDLRVLYASGLFVSVTMLLFSYLDSSVIGTSVFGASAFFCLVLLVLPGRADV